MIQTIMDTNDDDDKPHSIRLCFAYSDLYSRYFSFFLCNCFSPDTAFSTFQRFVYVNFFRSTAVFTGTAVLFAAGGSLMYDEAFEALWRSANKGKLYEDVIKQFPNLPPNTEEESKPEEEEPAEDTQEMAEDTEKSEEKSEEPAAEAE